jgi:hypothetical protein
MPGDFSRVIRDQIGRVAQAEAEVQSALWDLQREIICLDLLIGESRAAVTLRAIAADDARDNPRPAAGHGSQEGESESGGVP